jgi:uncharacterized protein
VTELNSHENDPLAIEPARSFSSEADSDAEVLEILDFTEMSVEQVHPNVSSLSQISIDNPPCWYHGIGEAFGWFCGVFLIQVVVAIVALVLILMLNHLNIVPGDDARELIEDKHFVDITLETLCLLATMLAVSWRYPGRMLSELNFSSPDPRHALIVIAGTVPLWCCESVWSGSIELGWDSLCELFPFLTSFDWLNATESIKQMARTAPLGASIFSIAVYPAIGEELIRRGAIGRALISNIGIWGGVLLTSFIFGSMHGHPVHALSVVPSGLFMHIVYLWTRSIWMPMLMHFVNNFGIALLMRYLNDDPETDMFSLTLLSGCELVAAIISFVALGFGLWQSRVRLVTEDGKDWNAGRFPVRIPADSGVHRQTGPMNPWTWRLAVVSCALCHALFMLNLACSS